MPSHFLSLLDFDKRTLERLLARGADLKRSLRSGEQHATCRGKVLAQIYEMASTRTRVAFETAIFQLGGTSIFMNPTDTQLGRGEPIADTARVLSQMVDIVMIRAQRHETIEEFAEFSDIPVINGMSNTGHPCQLLADMQTYVEHRGPIKDKTVAFVGDGYNVCNSFIEASLQFDFDLRLATPETHRPVAELLCSSPRTSWVSSPDVAVENADLVVTDVWSSMGHEDDVDRKDAFEGFQVTSALLDTASPDCLFMHCLPAHRGEEVDEHVLDDPRSVVWDEAGNRMHSQKALLEYLLAESR